MWRIWCEGHEFGIDYPSKEAARAARHEFRKWFPERRYTIRKARG